MPPWSGGSPRRGSGTPRRPPRFPRNAGTRARDFAAALEQELAALAMAGTRFEVRFDSGEVTDDRWTARGVDVAEFFVSPNPGEDVRPLARIVSGGELSRVMLALKTLATTDSPGKTLVFDEVDAGIGGRVADVVGQRLQALGRVFQVLCITHLPQIAVCGQVPLPCGQGRAGRPDAHDGRGALGAARGSTSWPA